MQATYLVTTHAAPPNVLDGSASAPGGARVSEHMPVCVCVAAAGGARAGGCRARRGVCCAALADGHAAGRPPPSRQLCVPGAAWSGQEPHVQGEDPGGLGRDIVI